MVVARRLGVSGCAAAFAQPACCSPAASLALRMTAAAVD